MRKYLKDLRLDEKDCCVECGGALGSGFGLDPACETCGTSDVNDVEFVGYHFDVFITDDGSLGLTVYEYGKSRHDEDARSVDIIVASDASNTIVA